jgi:hypothetical protein
MGQAVARRQLCADALDRVGDAVVDLLLHRTVTGPARRHASSEVNGAQLTRQDDRFRDAGWWLTLAFDPKG